MIGIIHKTSKIHFLSLAIGFLPLTNLKAQESDTTTSKFSMSLNFRPKLEVRDGAFRPLASNEKVAALVSDRLRLNIDYSYKNVLSIRISPQAVSVWGQAGMIEGPENSGTQLSVFETWAKIRISPSWYTQVGRQVISLDDERIFGALDWAQGGRVHDALSIHFEKKKFEVKGFFAYNQNYKTLYGNNTSNVSGYLYTPTGASPHKWMQTLWSSLPINDKNKITLLATNIGYQNAQINLNNAPEYFSQTFGANYFFNSKKVNVHLAGYYQVGRNASGNKISAYNTTVSASLAFNQNWSLGLGSDLISGNHAGTSQTRNNAFNPYFSTGHKFYGFMDYYYAGNGHGNVGISDSYLKLSFKGKKGFASNIVFHQFMTPNRVIDPIKEYNKNMGQEIDLTLSHKINDFVCVEGGYSVYLTTETINKLKGVINAKFIQNWAWVSLKVTPTLFNYKK